MRIALMLAIAIPFNAAAVATTADACVEALGGAIAANEAAIAASQAAREYLAASRAGGEFCTQTAFDRLDDDIAGYRALATAAAAVREHCQGTFAELGRDTEALAQRNLAIKRDAEAEFRRACGQ